MNNKVNENIWLPFIRSKWKKTIWLISAGLLVNFLTLLLPLSIGKYLQLTAAGGDGKTKALQLLGISLPDNLPVFFLFFIILILVKFACTWFYNFQLAQMGELFISNLRIKLYTHQLQQSKHKKPSSSVLLAYSNEAKTLQRYLTKGVIGFAKDVLFLLMSLYLLCMISLPVTMLILSSIILFFNFYKLLAKRQKNYSTQKIKSQNSLLNHVSASILQGSSGKGGVTEFVQKTDQYIATAVSWQFRMSFMNALAPAMLYFMLGASMFFMAFGNIGLTIEKTNILTYLLLLLSISPVLRKIIKIESTWVRGKQATYRYTKITGNTSAASKINPLEKVGDDLKTPKVDIITQLK